MHGLPGFRDAVGSRMLSFPFPGSPFQAATLRWADPEFRTSPFHGPRLCRGESSSGLPGAGTVGNGRFPFPGSFMAAAAGASGLPVSGLILPGVVVDWGGAGRSVLGLLPTGGSISSLALQFNTDRPTIMRVRDGVPAGSPE